FIFLSSRRLHTRSKRDWSSDVCSSDLVKGAVLDYAGTPPAATEVAALIDACRTPTDMRLVAIQRVLWAAAEGQVEPAETIERLMEATGIDRWFLDQMLLVAEIAAEVRTSKVLDAQLLALAKRHGLSDDQIGRLRGQHGDVIKGVREALGINPVY